MKLFNWLKSLFSKKPEELHPDIKYKLEKIAGEKYPSPDHSVTIYFWIGFFLFQIVLTPEFLTLYEFHYDLEYMKVYAKSQRAYYPHYRDSIENLRITTFTNAILIYMDSDVPCIVYELIDEDVYDIDNKNK